MKALISCTKQMFMQVKSDMMLAAVCFAPIVLGPIIRFVLPAIESRLTAEWGKAILSLYYPLFDFFLALIVPLMLCFATTMILLEEIDDKVSRTFSVSPLGKSGYLFVRLGVPVIITFFVNILILICFGLCEMSFWRLIMLAALGCIQAFIISMMIIVFSKNKLEGIAVVKMSSLLLLGLPAPYFLHGWGQYCLGILPSFWMGQISKATSLLSVLSVVFVSTIWISLLVRGFNRRLNG